MINDSEQKRLEEYVFDTSNYTIISSSVRRDAKTGRMIYSEDAEKYRFKKEIPFNVFLGEQGYWVADFSRT